MMTDDVLELTEEALSCRLHPVRCTTAELKAIWTEGAEAREADIPEFLCPYGPDSQDEINAWRRGWHARDYDLFVSDPEKIKQATEIIDLVCNNKDRTDLIAVGEAICLTQHTSGLPAEMSFTIFEEQNRFSATEKAMIMHAYLSKAIEHKRSSGTSYRRLRKLQEIHCEIVLTVLHTGIFRSVYHMPI